ncbi:coenzyme F420-0:L-glutamate ligase/NADPH-dependent F420 reductase [Caulobacter ginsengisoli]|uniref:Coenzyme F420-0:L-glutamate ligase/NADPH-dependent F420 reductase n=1 Tax=Caulobacter ginsengisoli TaxID=400775 RepID=A0ABU0IY32_9CAUL|nr:coenzyme F420-0:L-glutamate ligase [Caulobacter ginsengisoli]MDQ0466914.1 coenzyme F420-0:L-glutamate ligase/NADPH-dependent F420 reductase [Caulobacter ginsengisoli]
MASIAILGGTGALGSALAMRLARAGWTVVVGSRDAAKARDAAAGLAALYPDIAISGAGLAEAAARAEICVLAVPYAAHAETLAQVREAVAGKIFVDTTVPLRPPKVGTVQLPAAGAAAVEAAQALGETVRVVSALQTIGAEKLAAGGAIDADVLVAADDAEAAETVRALLADIGLRSWHVGPLANSAAAEAMTSLIIQINRRYKINQAGIRITGKPKDAPVTAMGLSVRPVPGLPHIAPGDDLAVLIGEAIIAGGVELAEGDVVVVAQKIVSKAEGRTVRLAAVTPGAEAIADAERTGRDAAMVELIRAESSEVMRVTPGVVIARHRLGHVAANAGIDQSNVAHDEGETALLWPVDPDHSAAVLREALQRRFGVRLAVVISDSLGRAWRMGTTGTAIGVSGLKPLRDRRGESDLFGRVLQATVTGVADEIAAAASLVIGEAAEGVPVAVVSGATYEPAENQGIGEILRPLDQDLFR